MACPDVVSKLPQIPDRARGEVDRNLALLQTQITDADRRLAAEVDRGAALIRNSILQPLASKRRATLDRIPPHRPGRPRPRGLAAPRRCKVAPTSIVHGCGTQRGGNNTVADNMAAHTCPPAPCWVSAPTNCDTTPCRARRFQTDRCVSTAFCAVEPPPTTLAADHASLPHQVCADPRHPVGLTPQLIRTASSRAGAVTRGEFAPTATAWGPRPFHTPAGCCRIRHAPRTRRRAGVFVATEDAWCREADGDHPFPAAGVRPEPLPVWPVTAPTASDDGAANHPASRCADRGN